MPSYHSGDDADSLTITLPDALPLEELTGEPLPEGTTELYTWGAIALDIHGKEDVRVNLVDGFLAGGYYPINDPDVYSRYVHGSMSNGTPAIRSSQVGYQFRVDMASLTPTCRKALETDQAYGTICPSRAGLLAVFSASHCVDKMIVASPHHSGSHLIHELPIMRDVTVPMTIHLTETEQMQEVSVKASAYLQLWVDHEIAPQGRESNGLSSAPPFTVLLPVRLLQRSKAYLAVHLCVKRFRTWASSC
jgi:hypothetical protein